MWQFLLFKYHWYLKSDSESSFRACFDAVLFASLTWKQIWEIKPLVGVDGRLHFVKLFATLLLEMGQNMYLYLGSFVQLHVDDLTGLETQFSDQKKSINAVII